MLISLFFSVVTVTIALLTFLSGLSYWFLPLWIVVGLAAGYFVVIFLFVVFVPLVKHSKETNRLKHYYARSMTDFINFLIFRIKIVDVVNKENIPKDTSYVLYPNHKSTYDAFIVKSIFKGPMAFAAKDSLYKVPVIAGWLSGIGSLKINRENDRETLKEIIRGIKLVKEGLSFTIFPEGTRTSKETSQMLASKAGAYRLATKAGVPIVPVALVGTGSVKGKKRDVTVVVGNPLYYDDYKEMSTTEISEIVVSSVNAIIKEYEQ